MQVQSINNTNFGRKRFISQSQLSNIRELVSKMNKEGLYTEDGIRFESGVTGVLKKDNVLFRSDLIYYINPIPEELISKLKSTIEIGKNAIEVENSTGEIVGLKKGFFTSFSKLMKEMEKYLEIFNQNFNNENVITKKRLNVCGFTQKGLELIK